MEEIVFTTEKLGCVASLQNQEIAALSQNNAAGPNATVRLPNGMLLVAQANKALLNVYNMNGFHKKESITQRIPLPEKLSALAIVPHLDATIDIPYLLLGATSQGTLYIWEMASGLLLQAKRMAHYQGIIKIQAFDNGRHIVTAGNDSRLLIWQTTDLVANIEDEEPKPIAIIHDHTLPITDFAISSTHGENIAASGTRLFTASNDSTIRCYNLHCNDAKSQKLAPVLITTFSLPFPINHMTVDPADRALYFTSSMGTYSLPLYYRTNSSTVIDLLANNSKNKIFTLVTETDMTLTRLFSMSQLLLTKLTSTASTLINISMDGSLLIIGEMTGSVSILEIFSRQVVRSIKPVTSNNDTVETPVNNLLVSIIEPQSTELIVSNIKQQSNNNKSWKLPSLQRVIYDNKGEHNIWVQLKPDTITSCEEESFESYLNRIASEETVFTQSRSVISDVKVVDTSNSLSSNDIKTSATKEDNSEEVTKLKENVETVMSAYKELREVHEKLFKEHEELLAKQQK